MMESDSEPILRVRDLDVRYVSSAGWFGSRERVVRAVAGISFELGRGETLGLVGESGCGKSTAARAILRLTSAQSGHVELNIADPGKPSEWVDLLRLSGRALRTARTHLQIVFQDPYASLNPRMTAGEIIAEPLRVFRIARGRDLAAKVQSLMAEVGLDPSHLKRYPHEFSGGQRQRIGIARALALNPKVVVCDEPISALDVSIRAQVLNLLLELQERRGLSYLFIAHDLSVVKRVCHRVAVMYLGRLVEVARADDLFSAPLHPYTRTLMSAIPIPDPARAREKRRQVKGEAPDPALPRVGCDFAGRCPDVRDVCREVIPDQTVIEGRRLVRCHLYEPELVSPEIRPPLSH